MERGLRRLHRVGLDRVFRRLRGETPETRDAARLELAVTMLVFPKLMVKKEHEAVI